MIRLFVIDFVERFRKFARASLFAAIASDASRGLLLPLTVSQRVART
jgi:hypothetical protein